MTLRRTLLGAVGAVIILGFGALFVLATFDWNRLKPVLNERISAALGRPVVIEGDLRLMWRRDMGAASSRAWLPLPTIEAKDIVITNVEGAKAPIFARVPRVVFNVYPLPLLAHQVVIRRLHITGPEINLERLPDGRANWIFAMHEAKQATDWRFDISEVVFDAGRINYVDPVQDTVLEVRVDPLGKPVPFAEIIGTSAVGGAVAEDDPPHYIFGWTAQGYYKALRLHAEGATGGMLELRDAKRLFPIKADIVLGATRAVMTGTLTNPLELAALDLRLKLFGSSMADLYPLIGVTLPDTPPYTTRGHLLAHLKNPGGARFEYRNFSGIVGESDFAGGLVFTLQNPRPKLKGYLYSNQLRFADLGPLIGVGHHDGVHQTGRHDKALPTQVFRTERWRTMDAEIDLHAKSILHRSNESMGDFVTYVNLDDGMLTLNPLQFGFAGGALKARLHLDGSGPVMNGEAALSARGLHLKELFPHVQAMQNTVGELNIDAALSGSGNSFAALLASADGRVKMLVEDGVISRDMMEIAGLNVGSYVVTRLFGDEVVPINCAAADASIDHGVLTTRLFVFDTDSALVDIRGALNFKDERMNLNVMPHRKEMHRLSLRSPLYVGGTFQHPESKVQKSSLLARGSGRPALGTLVAPAAALIALVAPGASATNPCVHLLDELQHAPQSLPPSYRPRQPAMH